MDAKEGCCSGFQEFICSLFCLKFCFLSHLGILRSKIRGNYKLNVTLDPLNKFHEITFYSLNLKGLNPGRLLLHNLVLLMFISSLITTLR